jgi:ribosomal-protein-alanine N-acetyltransferase
MNTVKEMRIETDRLIIRPFIQSDLVECFELMQDKELFKHLDWNVMSFEDFKGRILTKNEKRRIIKMNK